MEVRQQLRRAYRNPIVLFVAAVFVFQFAIWSARMGNQDSSYQLVTAVHLADTGSLGLTTAERASLAERTAPAEVRAQFARAGDDRWYQVHDPGNKVLMLPAALVARAAGWQAAGALEPSSVTKVLAAASIAAFVSLLPILVFLALRMLLPDPRAMRWAALGLVATVLLPYSKGTWDVYPCAVLVTATAYFALRRCSQPSSRWGWIGTFATAAGASWFRSSLAPFLLLGCVIVEVVASGHVRRLSAWAPRAAAGTLLSLILLAPVFALNTLVTGNPLRPPISLADVNRPFEHFPLVGALGLLGSPNRGLWVFTPILVLTIAVVWMWRGLPAALRSFVAAWTLPVAGYVLAIGSLASWGRGGWGPRYLVPIVPILWIPTAVVGARAFDRRGAARVVVIALLAVSTIVAAIGTLTNWENVSAIDPSISAQDTAYPKQIIETARYVESEIPVSDDPGQDADVDTKRWPDLATLHASRKAGVPDAIGYLAFTVLLALSIVCFVQADRRARLIEARDDCRAPAAAATQAAE